MVQRFEITVRSDNGIDSGQVAVAVENIGGDVMAVKATVRRQMRAEERLRAVTEAGRALVAAVDTWLRETQPGQHINTAKGRGASRRAVTALDAALSSQEPLPITQRSDDHD